MVGCIVTLDLPGLYEGAKRPVDMPCQCPEPQPREVVQRMQRQRPQADEHVLVHHDRHRPCPVSGHGLRQELRRQEQRQAGEPGASQRDLEPPARLVLEPKAQARNGFAVQLLDQRGSQAAALGANPAERRLRVAVQGGKDGYFGRRARLVSPKDGQRDHGAARGNKARRKGRLTREAGVH